MPIAKEATDLARRINALGDGWECVSKKGGKHGGGAYVVRRYGKYIVSFTSTNFDRGVVRTRVEAELRRKGVPLDVPAANGKEKVVATPTAESREATRDLVPRLRAALKALGGDTPANRTALSTRAAEIIGFRLEQGLDDVEQFGSTGGGKTAARDIARESLRSLLDQDRMATEKSSARWQAVLDMIEADESPNGDQAKPVPEIHLVEAAAQVEAPAEEAPVEAGPDEVQELRERAELAEGVVGEIEAERDEAKAALERAEHDATKKLEAAAAEREAQSERLGELEADVERLRLEAKEPEQALAEAKAEVTRLRRQLSGLKGGHAQSTNRRDREIAALERRLEVADQTREEAVAHQRLLNDEAMAALQTLVEEREAQLQAMTGLKNDLVRDVATARAENETYVSERERAQAERDEAVAELEVLGEKLTEYEALADRDRILDAYLEALRDTTPNPPRWLLARLDALAGIDPLL